MNRTVNMTLEEMWDYLTEAGIAAVAFVIYGVLNESRIIDLEDKVLMLIKSFLKRR